MKTFWRIFAHTKKYWWCYLIVGISMILQVFSQIYAPGIIRSFLSLLESNSADLKKYALTYGGILLGLAALQAITTGLRSYFSHVTAWRSIHELRIKLYTHVQNMSMSFFHNRQTGQLMSRILSDTQVLELLIAHAGPELVLDALLFVSIMIILFLSNWKLALIALLIVPFILLAAMHYAFKVRPKFKKAHAKTAELTAILQDDISGIKEIQVFNRQNYESERVQAISEEFTGLNLSALKKSAVFHPLISFFNQFGVSLIVAAGGMIAAYGGIKGSEIVAFILYLQMLYTPISSFGRISEDLQNSLAAGERVLELLDIQSEVVECENPVDIQNVKGELRFEDVNFSYIESREVLKNINLTIQPGETIALVGETGGGKTTITNLITRFYDPDSGRVLLDGQDIKTLSFRSLRDNISIVLQDVFLFHGTVVENIAYGANSPTQEEIIRAAKIANAHDFIREMENGYDTIIGERGVKLSGGQKQRLSIARAVLRDRPILILDEATAAVDNETERQIHNAIDNVIQNRTTIIIAHRLSTIRNADKIVVIEGGEIVETGSHEELMQIENGVYKHLHDSALS